MCHMNAVGAPAIQKMGTLFLALSKISEIYQHAGVTTDSGFRACVARSCAGLSAS